ncbi:type IV pilin, partial [Haloferax profundi]|uniref:type IV pilin n=1 Tax=Haloferax profundi TaxID=1544718 RepID=UPI0012FA0D3F
MANRGVSSVIATVLMVAVVVILAAVISAATFGFTSDLRHPGPTVAESSGRLLADLPG